MGGLLTEAGTVSFSRLVLDGTRFSWPEWGESERSRESECASSCAFMLEEELALAIGRKRERMVGTEALVYPDDGHVARRDVVPSP